ncbi:MAG: hypothetical protein AAB425_03600 [Bdellovibrionota bacterium]
MLKFFKKTLIIACAVSTLATGMNLVRSPSAHAAIGAIATGGAISVPVAIAAGSVLGLGLTYGIIVDVSWGDGMVVGTAVWSVIGLIIGGIILDEQSGQVSFAEIETEEKALSLGLNAAEAQAYNSELDQVNAVRETIEAEVATVDGDRLKAAEALWADYGANALSQDAWSAVQKVSHNLAVQLEAGANK